MPVCPVCPVHRLRNHVCFLLVAAHFQHSNRACWGVAAPTPSKFLWGIELANNPSGAAEYNHLMKENCKNWMGLWGNARPYKHWDLFSSNNTLLTKYRRQRKRNTKKMLWLTFHIFVNNRSPFERHQTTHMWIRYGKRIRTNCPSVTTRTLYSLYRYLQTCILRSCFLHQYIIAYAYDLKDEK